MLLHNRRKNRERDKGGHCTTNLLSLQGSAGHPARRTMFRAHGGVPTLSSLSAVPGVEMPMTLVNLTDEQLRLWIFRIGPGRRGSAVYFVAEIRLRQRSHKRGGHGVQQAKFRRVSCVKYKWNQRINVYGINWITWFNFRFGDPALGKTGSKGLEIKWEEVEKANCEPNSSTRNENRARCC